MLADTLRSSAGHRCVDADGEVTVLELLPPATDDQIGKLEASLPCRLPDELRAALAVTTGWVEAPVESFSLLDLEGIGMEDVFPHAYSVAHDGYGNYWVLDVLPDAADWGPVFYACHDPAVIAYQARSLDAFVQDLLRFAPDDSRSPIDHVHEAVVARLWRDHSALVAQPSALASSDPAMSEFARTLPSSALIADLRDPAPGDGFAWGRFGPRTEIRRFGAARMWALVPPAPKPGILRRLFGGA